MYTDGAEFGGALHDIATKDVERPLYRWRVDMIDVTALDDLASAVPLVRAPSKGRLEQVGFSVEDEILCELRARTRW